MTDELTVGIIPARAGSKRLPQKNWLMLDGRPLIGWTLEAALTAGSLDRMVCSTDSQEVATICAEYGVACVRRPGFLGTDDASVYDVVRHAMKCSSERPTTVVLLQPTSPLRTADDIDEAMTTFLDHEGKPVISVQEGETVANGAIYIAGAFNWSSRAFNFDKLKEPALYEMPAARSVDINTVEDFKKAEAFIEQQRATRH